VEVHGVRVALPLFVFAEDVHDLVAVDGEVRVVVLQLELERRARVDDKRVDVEQDVALREALLQSLDAEGAYGRLHRLFGVFPLPAPAITSIGPSPAMTTSSCSELSSSS